MDGDGTRRANRRTSAAPVMMVAGFPDRIRASAVLACAALTTWTAVRATYAEPAGRLIVGPNVVVSGANSAAPHMEVVACSDRASPPTLLAASMASLHGRWVTYVYRSGDGGKTWRQVLTTADPGSFGDPTCAFGADHRAYYAVLWGRRRFPDVRGVRSMGTWIYSSNDAGRSWVPPTKQMLAIDRPFLAVDQSRAGRSHYLYYSALWAADSLNERDPTKVGPDDPNVESGIGLFVSTDNGKSFSLAAPPRQGRGDWVHAPGNTVVTASGELVTPFRVLEDRLARPYLERSGDESTLSVIRTAPGGEPSEPAISVGTVQGSSFAALALDATRGGRFSNRVYAAAVRGRSIVLFSSDDEGRTWRGPATVRNVMSPADGSTVPALFNPAVAANRDSVVGVAWAEGTHAKDNFYIRSWTYRMAASWDGGTTFSDSVAVSSASHDASRAARISLMGSIRRDGRERQRGSVIVDVFADSGGHTFGLADSPDGLFHAAWTDNRTGVSQVWTAAVRAERVATPRTSR